MKDVIIIGAGVIGAAVARELSRYCGDFMLVEKTEDLCSGTSKANSGIVHGGYDAKPGSLKALMNVEGAKRMPRLSEQLDFPYKNNGSIVLCFTEEGRQGLEKLYRQGVQNGVRGMKILDRAALLEIEPNVGETALYGLYCQSAGIVCPFNLTIALAENAAQNGVAFQMNTAVTAIRREKDGHYVLETTQGPLETRAVINCAGLYADDIHNMVSQDTFHIHAVSGEYFLLDKETDGFVRQTLFQLPTEKGKGILVTPTVDGNTLVGPTAVGREDKSDIETTFEGMREIREKSAMSVKDLPLWKTITGFTGNRAQSDRGDFILGEAQDAPNFFDCAGIESPGLSSAPAIGDYMAHLVSHKLQLTKKKDFEPCRRGIPLIKEMTREEHAEMIRQDPLYGHIVCRCEWVTEGEIVRAIRRPLGARTLDGVKRRTRAGAGRCQGGFCMPKVMEILARETGRPMKEICKNTEGSYLITGKTKGETDGE